MCTQTPDTGAGLYSCLIRQSTTACEEGQPPLGGGSNLCLYTHCTALLRAAACWHTRLNTFIHAPYTTAKRRRCTNDTQHNTLLCTVTALKVCRSVAIVLDHNSAVLFGVVLFGVALFGVVHVQKCARPTKSHQTVLKPQQCSTPSCDVGEGTHLCIVDIFAQPSRAMHSPHI